MPRGDRTGPRGAGPMTGRAAGYCAGYSVPGYMNPTITYRRGWGRGFGRGRGRGFGRGWGRGFGRGQFGYPAPVLIEPTYPPVYQQTMQPQTPEQEMASLEEYQKDLKAEKADIDQEMAGVKARIEELKAKKEK